MLRVNDKSPTSRAGRGTDPPRARSARRKLQAAATPVAEIASPAAVRQAAQLPTFAPIMEEVEVAGWSSHRRQLSGNFHDWLLLGDGRLLVAVGHAAGDESCDPIVAALVAQAAWTAVRAHALHARDAGTLLSLAARTLWPIPSANVHACVAAVFIDAVGGSASLAIAGDAFAWRVRAATSEQFLGTQPALGAVADPSYRTHRIELALRERLLLMADNPQRRTSGVMTSTVATFSHVDVENHRRMTAADAVGLAREEYEVSAANDPLASASIAAVRRR